MIGPIQNPVWQAWAVQRADNHMPVAGENHATEAEALVAALESGGGGA